MSKLDYKYSCVVDADNLYKTFVLVYLEPGENGETRETVSGYELAEGEHLLDKADKNRALQSDLYAQYARDVQAPNLNITPEILFNNPPLDNMALLDHRAVAYVKADRPAGAPPMSSSMPAHYCVLDIFLIERSECHGCKTGAYERVGRGGIIAGTGAKPDKALPPVPGRTWSGKPCRCQAILSIGTKLRETGYSIAKVMMLYMSKVS